MSQSQFGENLKARRKAMGMTQAQLGERSGTSQNYISSLESGERKKPSYDVVERLAQVLGCSPKDLTGDSSAESLTWFWKSRFSTLSDGDLIHLRRLSIEERAQWICRQAAEALGRDEVLTRTDLTDRQLSEILELPKVLTPDQADKLAKLDLPANFLISGNTPPRDEDLQVLLTSPDSAAWLRFFRKCQAENVLPATLDLLLNAALSTRAQR